MPMLYILMVNTFLISFKHSIAFKWKLPCMLSSINLIIIFFICVNAVSTRSILFSVIILRKSSSGDTVPISFMISSAFSKPNFYLAIISVISSAAWSISTTSSSPTYPIYSVSYNYFQNTFRSTTFLISCFLNLNNYFILSISYLEYS